MNQKFQQVLNTFMQQTKKPVIRLQADRSLKVPDITGSWFLGYPYIPKGEKWPTGTHGRQLSLVAQLNFDQLPELPGFPTTGLLQFFIAKRAQRYGFDMQTPTVQKDWRVIYRPTYTADALDKYIPSLGSLTPFTAEKVEEPMTIDDFRFDAAFLRLYNEVMGKDVQSIYDLPDDECKAVVRTFMLEYSRIGGYTRNTQMDIRGFPGYGEYTTTLLQVVSDNTVGIDWVDNGTVSFYIKPEQLAALDFSDVLYYLDFC